MILFVLFPAAAYSSDARIDGVEVVRGNDLKVSFEVKNAFTKEIEEAIHSGIPTSFTFFIELYRKRSLWFDEPLGRWRFSHTVKYDSLKEEYEVSLDEKGRTGIRTSDFEEVKRLMTEETNFTVRPTVPFVKGNQYILKIKAELDTIDLPFFLDYLLFFVKFWDFETDWYVYRFTP